MRQIGTKENPRRIPPKRRPPDPNRVHKRKTVPKPTRWYLFGDWLAYGLAKGYVIPFFKLTKKRYRIIKYRCGFSKTCGCGNRQEGLNVVGRFVHRLRLRFRRPPFHPLKIKPR